MRGKGGESKTEEMHTCTHTRTRTHTHTLQVGEYGATEDGRGWGGRDKEETSNRSHYITCQPPHTTPCPREEYVDDTQT